MEKAAGSYFELKIAGRGGQGALIIGRLLAEAGMSKYEHVSYFPNYGATMRGGDSECTVILSNSEISAPAMLEPSSLVLMGSAALGEFERKVKPSGLIILDSSLVAQKVTREDLRVVYLPAVKVASELGNSQIANFIFLGAYLKMTGAVPFDTINQALETKMAGGNKEELLALDKQALREGARIAAEQKG